MNPYFWFLAVWAALITPVTFRAGVRIGKEVKWKLRIQIAGLPFMSLKAKGEQKEENTAFLGRLGETLGILDGRMAASLWHSGAFGRFMKAFKLDSMDVYLTLSFEDAAVTALLYALIRNALQTLALCGAMPRKITGRIEMDFQSRGTQCILLGIVSCRVGTLGLAAARLIWEILRMRAKHLTAEEEENAAASH